MRLGRKVRTQGRTVVQGTSYGNSQFSEDEEDLPPIVIEPIVGSMNTIVGGRIIPETDFQEVTGANIRDGKAISVLGPVTQTPTKPNSNKILGLVNINNAGTITGLRFTKSTLHKLSGGVFTAITGAGLTGGDYDRFQVLYVEGRTFFNNNGVQVLQEANLTANTYAAAGNARRYKYYVVCNRRIVGAHLLAGTNDPTEVAGSGDRNYTQWDPLVDISSFKGSLIDTEGTSIDEITGLASSNDDKLVVFRSNSIWIGYPQPIASTPFNFKKVSHIGCNAPYSIREVHDGVVWYDPFKRNVFHLNFTTEEIKPVGDKIKNNILSSVGDPVRIFSAYDEHNNEYELGYEFVPGDVGRVFVLNRTTESWSTYLITKGSCISNDISLQPSVTIDGLGSTPIDSLSGTIDSLSEDRLIVTKIFGTNDGERVAPTNSVSGCSVILKTKTFSIPKYRQFIEKIELVLTRNAISLVVLGYFTRGAGTFGYIIKSISITGGNSTVITIPVNRECIDFAAALQINTGYSEVQSIKIYRKLAGLI